MSTTNLIEIKNVSKSFGKRQVIEKLNLSVEQGDIYGFLGPNGSGKTTTIRMILGLIHPNEGEIILNGASIKTDFIKAIHEVGAIVENPSFYTYLSGYDNLWLMANLHKELDKERIDEVLAIVKLKERAKDKVKTYSLGMKQRLGIAMALLNRPNLIILDEPTNGLDPQGMKEVKELIAFLAKEQRITFFISSHLLFEVEQICTKVGILKEGHLVAQGNVKELLSSKYETVEVSTKDQDKAMAILKNIAFVKSVKPSEQGVLVEMEKDNSSKLMPLLVNNNVEVTLLVPKNNTLEQYFFGLTGGGEGHA